MKKLYLRIAVMVLALAMGAVVLAGCAGHGTLSDTIDDETGAYTVTADDAGKGSALGSFGGGIKVEQGQLLVLSPDLSKGSLQVRLLGGTNGEEVILDQEASGHVLSTYELDPGDYSFGVTCNEDGTTGTLVIVTVDAAEFEKQNQDLEAAMAAAEGK